MSYVLIIYLLLNTLLNYLNLFKYIIKIDKIFFGLCIIQFFVLNIQILNAVLAATLNNRGSHHRQEVIFDLLFIKINFPICRIKLIVGPPWRRSLRDSLPGIPSLNIHIYESCPTSIPRSKYFPILTSKSESGSNQF